MTPAPTAYRLSDDPSEVDLDALWRFLSQQAYWGRWRDREVVEQQVRGAWRVVGAYDPGSGAMVGFCRAISDGVALAYLADVYVLEEYRGHGIGKALVTAMIEEGPGREFRWLLHTDDAHGLYAGLGFGPPDRTFMERLAQGARRRGPG